MPCELASETTTTVLLRSIVRIFGAQAALVVNLDSCTLLAAHGVSAAEATALLPPLVAGPTLPGDGEVALRVALPGRGVDAATLVVLGRRLDASPPGEAIRILLDELAAGIARIDAPPLERSATPTPASLAVGIDALNDAAAIVEWPAVDAQPRILHVNGGFIELLGYPAAEVIGQTLEMFAGPLTDRNRIAFMHERVRETSAARLPVVCYRRDGVPIWIEVSLRGVAAGGASACMVATLRDVTARKEFEFALAKEKRKLQVTLAAIGDAVITTVADGRIDYVNLAARTLLAIDAADAYGKPIAEVLRVRDAAGAVIDVLHGARDAGDGYRGQAHYGHGRARKDVAYVSSPIGSEGFVVVLRDITAQQRLSTQLSYEASHDPLTGIFNRRKFEQVLDDGIASARAGAGPHALAMLDLDRFKVINDTCGHAVGDRVLREVAHLLRDQLRERDIVARIGGDEFAILLHDCSLDNARRVFDGLHVAVNAYRLEHAGQSYGVGVSIGVALIDGADRDAGRIMARADADCYAAKAARKNTAR